jgi:hypothetical protein
VLESRGLDVILSNGREVRAVPKRKPDVNDAQWVATARVGVATGKFAAKDIHGGLGIRQCEGQFLRGGFKKPMRIA